MIDAEDRGYLSKAKEMAEESPSWKDPWQSYLLVVGGIILLVFDVVKGRRFDEGSAGGLILGLGIGSLVIAMPITRVIWRLARLVRHAEEKGAFEN